MPKCTDCRFCVETDYGYSNYSTEGTEVYCLLGLNPKLPEDRFYGEEPTLLYATKCDKFTPGDHPHLDVEHDCCGPETYTDDPEILVLLRKWLED